MKEGIEQENEMRREPGLLDATMLVAGSMIGSGIFIVSSDIVRNVGSAGWLIFIWVLAGVITLIAALSYGELSSMFPNAGGQYVYLRAAYGRMVAFLYGWSFFMVIQTGTIAVVGVAFAKFAAYVFPVAGENVILLRLGIVNITAAQVLAIFTIILLTWLNSRSLECALGHRHSGGRSHSRYCHFRRYCIVHGGFYLFKRRMEQRHLYRRRD